MPNVILALSISPNKNILRYFRAVIHPAGKAPPNPHIPPAPGSTGERNEGSQIASDTQGLLRLNSRLTQGYTELRTYACYIRL